MMIAIHLAGYSWLDADKLRANVAHLEHAVAATGPHVLAVIAALAGAAFLAELAKQLVLRPRPDLFPALTAVASPLSFPSGHAMQVAAAGAAGVALAWHLAPRWKPVPSADEIRALEGMADDYVVKPFGLEQIAARIEDPRPQREDR